MKGTIIYPSLHKKYKKTFFLNNHICSNLSWIGYYEGFYEMVKQIWEHCSGRLERWQAKIRRLRQYLRGCVKIVGGVYKEKKSLLDKLDEFEKNQK